MFSSKPTMINQCATPIGTRAAGQLKAICFPSLRYRLLFSIVFCWLSTAHAQSLRVNTSSAGALVGEEVQITLFSDRAASYCGVHVEYGGTNEPPTQIRMNANSPTLSYTFKKAFPAPGVVQIRVFGARVMSALGCSGEARTTLTISPADVTQVVSLSAPLQTQKSPAIGDFQAKVKAGDLAAAYTLANILASEGENIEALKLFLPLQSATTLNQ